MGRIFAGDPIDAGWGQLVALENLPSVYGVAINKNSDVERLPIPASIPEVLRASKLNGETLDYSLQYSSDGTQRFLVLPTPPDSVAREPFLIETASSTQQFADGRILLHASDAKLHGKTLQLETNATNTRVGFWTDPADWISWNYTASRWGKYDVILTYSSQSPLGSDVTVQVGDQVLTTHLEPTGDWYSYHALNAGSIYLAEAGDIEIAVRCQKLEGNAVMNLKGITLFPACEGASPQQASDGSILLHSRDSIVRGTNLRYEPNPKKITLGYWTLVSDAAQWNFVVDRPGKFTVEVWQGCGTNQGGSEAVVRLGSQQLSFVVEETGHFQNFIPRDIGTLTIEQAGSYWLAIQPVRIQAQAAMDIRQIRLIPLPGQ